MSTWRAAANAIEAYVVFRLHLLVFLGLSLLDLRPLSRTVGILAVAVVRELLPLARVGVFR